LGKAAKQTASVGVAAAVLKSSSLVLATMQGLDRIMRGLLWCGLFCVLIGCADKAQSGR
jgi:hypothetical protein